MNLSVIIPTYRRPLELQRALGSLLSQHQRDFEVVIVDNAASSEVHELVARVAEDSPIPIKYVAEPRLGLHHARHAGARSATGELLVFTDDDATFDADWLTAYTRAFARDRGMVAAGGPVRPMWESTPPEWLLAYRGSKPIFPILSLMDLRGDPTVSEGGIFFGVNMAIRRQTLFDLGGFNPEAFGDDWLGNGETGLNRKLAERKLLVGYVSDAIVYHHIPGSRMTLDYFRHRMRNEGACDMYTRFHRGIPSLQGLRMQAGFIAFRTCVLWLMAAVVGGRTDFLSLRIQLHAHRASGQLRYVRRLMDDGEFREFVTRQDWLDDSCTSE